MLVDITNRTDRRVLLRFNSGLTRYLAPGEILRAVEHVEVKNSSSLSHLEDKHVIAVEPAGSQDTRQSKQMRADEAVAHIQATPREQLGSFLSPDEDRTTVLRAMQEKRE